MELDDLLTDKDVARYMKLAKKTGHLSVRKWARAGRIKAGKAGDHWRFRKADVDDFMFAGHNHRR